MAPCEFTKKVSAASLCNRQFNGDQQFLGSQCRLKNSQEEIDSVNSPLAAFTPNHESGIKRKHTGRKLGSGIGMRKAATDRSPVADSGMGDMRDRLRQERSVFGNFGG